jgi:hypothetical protein
MCGLFYSILCSVCDGSCRSYYFACAGNKVFDLEKFLCRCTVEIFVTVKISLILNAFCGRKCIFVVNRLCNCFLRLYSCPASCFFRELSCVAKELRLSICRLYCIFSKHVQQNVLKPVNGILPECFQYNR